MAQALNENLDSSLTFLRNCSLVGSDAAGWCTQEDGHVAATFPVAGQDSWTLTVLKQQEQSLGALK